jgi:hypothetical protein
VRRELAELQRLNAPASSIRLLQRELNDAQRAERLRERGARLEGSGDPTLVGGANDYTDFLHEWQRVHGGTWACAYMNGIDLYYRSKLMTRAARNRAIRDWDNDVPDDVLAAASSAAGPSGNRVDFVALAAAGPSGNPVDFVAPRNRYRETTPIGGPQLRREISARQESQARLDAELSAAEATLARVAASEAQTRPLEPRPRRAYADIHRELMSRPLPQPPLVQGVAPAGNWVQAPPRRPGRARVRASDEVGY